MRRIASVLAALGLINVAVGDLAPRCEPGATHPMAAMQAMSVADGPTLSQSGDAPCAPTHHGQCRGISMLGCTTTCSTTATGLVRSLAAALTIPPISLAAPPPLTAFAAWRHAPEPPPPRAI
jgi:hypothetical protein